MNGEIEITRYTWHCFSSRERADIVLFLYDGRSNVAGQVFAVPDGEPLPPAERRDGRALLYFHRAAVPQLIDLLRNEGPVFLRWDERGEAVLETGYEPVGEGEGGGHGART